MYRNKRMRGTKEIVTDIFSEHPEWNARQVYDRYLLLVDSKKAVTLNAVQKQLERIKPTASALLKEGLKQPWHMGTLIKHPLPPDVIPLILKSQKQEPDIVITIQMALWMGRFYTTIKDLRYLVRVAYFYSIYEWKMKFTESELDTSWLDNTSGTAILRMWDSYCEWCHKKLYEMTGEKNIEPIQTSGLFEWINDNKEGENNER